VINEMEFLGSKVLRQVVQLDLAMMRAHASKERAQTQRRILLDSVDLDSEIVINAILAVISLLWL